MPPKPNGSNTDIGSSSNIQGGFLPPEDWEPLGFFLLPDQITALDFSSQKHQQLCDLIGGGFRSKFTVLTKQDVYTWVADNSKDLKAQLDSEGANVSESTTAACVRAYLYQQQVEGREAKGIVVKKEEVDKSGKKSPKKPSTPAGGVKPGSATKPSDKPDAKAAAAAKAGTKIRDRQAPRGNDAKSSSIGDEPIYGPDVYYYFKDFATPEIMESILEVVPSVVLRICDSPRGDSPKTRGPPLVPGENPTYKLIREASKPSFQTTVWGQLIFDSISSSEWAGGFKEYFEVITKHLYAIVDRKKQYEEYFASFSNVLPIPDAQGIDLRYYTHLSNLAFQNVELSSPELCLSLALLQALNQGFDSPMPDFFANAVGKSAKALGLSESNDDEFILSSHDFNRRIIESLENLKNIGIDVKSLINNDAFNKKETNLCSIANKEAAFDSIRQSGEFKQIVGSDLYLEHQILLYQFERLFGFPKGSITSAEFRWREILSMDALTQLLQKRQCMQSVVRKNFSQHHGLNLISISSPGPVGALQYSEAENISALNRVAFGPYCDSLANTDVASGGAERKPMDPKNDGVCYITGDAPISIQQKNQWFYPADGVKIKVQSAGAGTIISWNENVITFAANNELTASLRDGSVFAIDRNGQAAFSTQAGDWAQFNEKPGGDLISISLKNFHRLPEKLGKVSNERSSVFLKTGAVIRYLPEGIAQVLFADGATAQGQVGNHNSWTTISSKGIKTYLDTKKTETIPTTTETDPANDTVTKSRSDNVTIDKLNSENYKVTHADGTVISTLFAKLICISNSSGPQIFFDLTNNTETVELSSTFSITRSYSKMENTVTYSIETPDVKIKLSPQSGEGKVNFSVQGFETAIPKASNCLLFNYKSGAFVFKDILNYTFSRDATSESVLIAKPAQSIKVPVRQFGPSKLRSLLRKYHPFEGVVGNIPSLFCVLPESQGGFEILNNSQIQKYYNSAPSGFDRDQEFSASDNSISLSITQTIRAFPNPLVTYKHFEYLADLDKKADLELRNKYEVFLDVLAKRTEAYIHNYEATQSKITNHVYGSNKFDTLVSIILQSMMKDSQSTTAQPNKTWLKPRFIHEAATKLHSQKKLPKYSDGLTEEAKQIGKKYFETTEGKAALELIKAEVEKYRNKNQEQDQWQEVIEAHQNEEVPFDSIPIQMVESSIATKEKSPDMNQASMAFEADHAGFIPMESENVDAHETEVSSHSQAHKRYLGLPQPESEPNMIYLNREGPTKRVTSTASTKMIRKKGLKLGGFVVAPPLCDFGPIVAGNLYELFVTLTNVGIDSTRFKIKKQEASLIHVEHKAGLVAPGMSVSLKLRIKAPATPISGYKEKIDIYTESEILHLVVKAHVLSQEEFVGKEVLLNNLVTPIS